MNAHDEAMTRVDGCPSCASNYEPPRLARPNPDGGYLCAYTCTDCGHSWVTAWSVERNRRI